MTLRFSRYDVMILNNSISNINKNVTFGEEI